MSWPDLHYKLCNQDHPTERRSQPSAMFPQASCHERTKAIQSPRYISDEQSKAKLTNPSYVPGVSFPEWPLVSALCQEKYTSLNFILIF